MKTKFAIIAGVITLILLIAGLIVTIFFIRQSQETRSRAEGSASLSWTATPITASVGDTISLTISATSPAVSIDGIQMQIGFDSFDKVEIDKQDGKFKISPSIQFPSVLQEPALVGNELRFAFAASANLAEVKGTNIDVATIVLKAKAPGTAQLSMVQTAGAGTRLSGPGGAGNLLASSGYPAPLTITVGDTGGPIAPTTPPSATTTPTTTLIPNPPTTPLPTTTITTPACTSLDMQPTSGNAPLTVNFTGKGENAAGVSAIEFSYGEGATQLVEKNYGASASETVSHTYQAAGTFQAFVRVRSTSGTWSSIPSSCTGQITVAPPASVGGGTHYSCQAGSCVAVAGSGIDECNPGQANSCQMPKEISRLPTSGSISPTIIAIISGILLLTVGSLVLR